MVGICSLDQLAVEVLDAMPLIHNQELPASVHEVLLVSHANFIGGHNHRKSLLTDWLTGRAFLFLARGRSTCSFTALGIMIGSHDRVRLGSAW